MRIDVHAMVNVGGRFASLDMLHAEPDLSATLLVNLKANIAGGVIAGRFKFLPSPAVSGGGWFHRYTICTKGCRLWPVRSRVPSRPPKSRVIDGRGAYNGNDL
jgi:hypothetical protein